jgi:hypothetical protein
MTTSEPEAGRRADQLRDDHVRDDGSREHRGLGQRLRDAVLGEPVETRRPEDDTGAREAEPQGGEPGRHHVEPDRVPEYDDRATDHGDRDPDRLDTGLTGAATAAPAGRGPDPAGADAVRSDTGTERTGNPDARTAGTGTADAEPDFVTSSYDPDRDTSYDPRAAGTAMTDVERRDYEPADDAGYVDQDRADTDRATGHDDADYDTGRVDAPRGDRDGGSHAGSAAAAGGVAAGAAAGLAAMHRDRTDADDRGADRADRATDDRATDDRAAAVAADDRDSAGRERLIPADRARDYSSRWDALKGDFVDEPRRAVRQADELVGELLDEIQQLFARQRRELEQGLDNDQASTEDLRLGLRRYRSFFDRLLSF